MKEVTRTGSLILKALSEQKNVIHLKTLLDTSKESKEKEEAASLSNSSEAPQEEAYCTLFASSCGSSHADATANHLSSSYFLSSITPSTPTLFFLCLFLILDLFILTLKTRRCLLEKQLQACITNLPEFHQDLP